MSSKLLFLFIAWCVFSVYESVNYPPPDSMIFVRRKHPTLEHMTLFSECKVDVVMEMLNVSMSTLLDFSGGKTKVFVRDFGSHARICELLGKCDVTAKREQCEYMKVPGIELEWECIIFTYKMNDMNCRSIIKSLKDVNHVLSRQRRNSRGTCVHPKSLSLSLLKTTFYNRGIKIEQKCKYGTTLSNGISRVYQCRYNEDVWHPEEFAFEPCEPFIQCEMTLKYHGTAKCTTATIDVPPVCNVSCPRYEDKPAVEKTTRCDIDGIWKPELPHCAAKVDGEQLVPPPEIKLHYLEEQIAQGLGDATKSI